MGLLKGKTLQEKATDQRAKVEMKSLKLAESRLDTAQIEERNRRKQAVARLVA